MEAGLGNRSRLFQMKKVIVEVENNRLDDDAFRELKSLFRHLTDDQCQKALRVLVLAQPAEDAEQAMLARIADFIAFGTKYGDMPRAEALAQFKEQLTAENLREAWNDCGF